MGMGFLSQTSNSPIIYFLDLGIILGGLGVVFWRKIIYSALFLGLVFVCVALLYLLLNADFLAAAQILIYVGAINVLIVFAIMLINKPDNQISQGKKTFGDILSGISVLGLFSLLVLMIENTTWVQPSTGNKSIENSFQSVDRIGIHFLTDLLLPFELLSILLLVALVGAIVIARKEINIPFGSTGKIEKN